MSVNPSPATDSFLSTFSAGASLTGLAAQVAFNTASFDYGAKLLDSDVSVSLDDGGSLSDVVLTVGGLVQGDTVGLRLRDAGSPFAITADPTLPEGSYNLLMDGDMIGIMVFGYDNGAQNMPFELRFTGMVTAATIEAVIENLQFSTIAEPGNRTLSLALSPVEGGGSLFAQDISVAMVPEIGGIAEHTWIDTANPSGALANLATLPLGEYSGRKLIVSGIIGLSDLPSIVQNSTFSLDKSGPDHHSLYKVFWFGTHFANITMPEAYHTGNLEIEFLMSGTSSGLAASLLSDLRLSGSGSRDLTITVADADGGILARSETTLSYGKPALTDTNSPDKMRAGAGPFLIDSDVTVETPSGFTLAGARLEVTNLALGDRVAISDAGPLRVDGSGNLILNLGGDNLTIGTFLGGSHELDANGRAMSIPAVVQFNANAPAWVLETLIENLTLESVGRYSTARRELNLSAYNAQGNRWFNDKFIIDVAGREITDLKEVHYNTGGTNPQFAPFVDTSITLAPGTYTGWTLEVSTDNGNFFGTPGIGVNSRSGAYFYTQGHPDQSLTLNYVNPFGHASVVGSYQGTPLANSEFGSGFIIRVAAESTWSAEMLEHLIESITMIAGGPAGARSSITYKLSDAQGVIYEDTVQVEKTDPLPGIGGLSSQVTVRSAVVALDGPALIDADVAPPVISESGPVSVTVTGQVAGDVLGLRASETPAPGQLVLDDSGLLYRQGASDGEIALLGYVSGGTGDAALRIDFFVGVTAAQVRSVIEALTFTSTSTVQSRELAITVLQDGQAVQRGFVEVILDTTPLIPGMTRQVKYDSTQVAFRPMVIDNDVTLPTDLPYGRAEIVINRPSHVKIGLAGGYSMVEIDFNLFDIMDPTGARVALLNRFLSSSAIAFVAEATRADVEALMEALTFETDLGAVPFDLTVRLNLQLEPSGARTTVAMTDLRMKPIRNLVLNGTDDADVLTGDEDNDVLSGLEGDDMLSGLDGNDTLFGGSGNDSLFGGSGDDTLNGDDGDDMLWGDEGRDLLSGGSGNDILSGATGNDTLSGDVGDDVLSGLNGRDTLRGGDGNDRLMGGNGRDRLFGDAGNDTLLGEGGNDTLRGATGDDSLHGGWGADTLYGDLGADTLTGGEGNDALFGGAGADRLGGGNGNDTLVGGIGADTLNGGSGADVFLFDLADVGTGVDVIQRFEQGQDMLMFTPALIDFLGSAGTSATEAIHWDLASRTLSLDLDAVGLTGGRVAIARFTGSIPETLTVDDFLFG